MPVKSLFGGLPIEETHELDAASKSWVMKPAYSQRYKETIAEQVKSWLEGKPIHNKFSDECCPDFSCCQPELLWPEEKRKLFVAADKKTQHEMLWGSMGDLIKKEAPQTKAYIAGSVDPEATKH